MGKPRLLDLFCGAGGCAVGYARAGFEVVGVDIAPQPHYPFEFIQADALSFPLDGFDVTHWSPLCQGYTELNFKGKEGYPRLIAACRERALASKKLYVIENVEGALSEFPSALVLCGSMFGLQVRRHRLFESNTLLFSPCHCQHDRNFYSIHGHHVWNRTKRSQPRKDGRWRPGYGTVEEGMAAMGIDWMHGQKEISQAIPPAYTEYIGRQLIAILEGEATYAPTTNR